MERLLAGPWISEFGWEVMAWQGHLRAIAPEYEHVTVCGPTGHEGMYEFADKYIPIDVPTLEANMWMNNSERERALESFKFLTGGDEFSSKSIHHIDPYIIWGDLASMNKGDLVTAIKPQKFKRFGMRGRARGYDIVYHARNRTDWDSGYRNWEKDQCEEYIKGLNGYKVACIGRKNMAHYCGGDDLRGLPLSLLADTLASSRFLIGPISGPTHFGALCGISEITWAVKAEHELRVKYKWNPFNVRVECITADDSVWRSRTPWTPEIEELLCLTEKMLMCEEMVA